MATLAMLATPEELTLKQQVTDALAEQGVLAKMKAELRAAVFRVMHDSAMPSTAEKPGPKLNAFPAEVTDVVMELVSECFAFFQWNHSLLVLRAEANVETTIELPVDGKKLAQKLGLLGEVNMPALLCLVQERLAPREEKQIPAVTAAQLSQNEDFGVTAAALRFKSASLARQDEDKGKDSADEDHSIEAGEISEEEDVSQQEEEEDGELETTAPIDSNFTTPSTRRNQNDADTVEKTNDVVAISNFEGHESDEYENDHFERTRAALVSKTSINDQDGDNGEEEHAAMKPDTNAIAMKDVDDEDDEEVELEESVAEDSMADDYASASDFESSIDPANAAPSTLPPPQLQDDNDDDENDTHPPPVPMHMMPLYHPFPSIASPTLANDHEDDNAGARDDGFDPEEEAARISSLDAKLKAMEAEDDTGTLQQLKASLQLELQRDTDGDADDGDGEGYGSSDFEVEEEVASEISEEVESMVQESEEEEEGATREKQDPKEGKQEAAVPTELQEDRAVASEDVLNSYDYVEPVERPW